MAHDVIRQGNFPAAQRPVLSLPGEVSSRRRLLLPRGDWLPVPTADRAAQ